MNLSMNTHHLKLVQHPGEVGEFLAETLGYEHASAEEYAQDLSQLEKQVFLCLPTVPKKMFEDVEEVEFLINVARSCILGLCFAQSKTPPEGHGYCVITHCIAVLAIEQAIGNIEAWIDWAAEEFKADLSVTVH